MGWLPVVRHLLSYALKLLFTPLKLKEEALHKKKKTFSDHKRVVWHEAMRTILESIKFYSKEGYCFIGADGVKRTVFPCIFILYGDYEEQ